MKRDETAVCEVCGKTYPARQQRQYITSLHETSHITCCKPCAKLSVKLLWEGKKPTLKPGEKWCAACEQVHPATTEYFYLSKRTTDGLSIKCKECRRKEAREKNLTNPDRSNEYAQRRRARKLAAGGSYTPTDVRLQLKVQKGLCWWCGKPLNGRYHVDHRIPIVKLGSNSAGNIVCACPECNLSKNDKMPWDFNGRRCDIKGSLT